MQSLPLVSICIPTYNHGAVLGDALRSAMLQNYGNIEILIVDNHSSDDTQKVVAKISSRDERVRYIRNPTNLGMVGNFNACIAAANGNYIKFLCADDLLMSNCVATMVDAFESRPETVLVASARLFVDEILTALRIAGFSHRKLCNDGASVIRDCFFRGNLIGEPTAVMFRRLQGLRGFREDYRQLMDLEMWMYLLQFGSFSYVEQPLCRVRQYSQQATQQHLKSGIVLHDKRQLFHEFNGSISQATFIDKLCWDIRMAVTLIRTKRANPESAEPKVEEVYFRAFFLWLTLPVAWLIWAAVSSKR